MGMKKRREYQEEMGMKEKKEEGRGGKEKSRLTQMMPERKKGKIISTQMPKRRGIAGI